MQLAAAHLFWALAAATWIARLLGGAVAGDALVNLVQSLIEKLLAVDVSARVAPLFQGVVEG